MSKADETRQRVRDAALGVFARHGYRRTTMADLAGAAGMSRPALYLVFPGKEAVFRDLAEAMLGGAVEAAEAAWPPRTAVADGLAAAILAKDLPVFRLLAASPHGMEILADTQALTSGLHDRLAARFHALVAGRLAVAGVAEPEAQARMLVKAADGLKHAGGPEADYVADVRRLAGMVG